MTRRFFGICGALTGLALLGVGCIDDPLADLDGGPAALVTSHSALQLSQGEAFPVTVTVVDGRSTPLQVAVTAASCDAAVTAAPDPAYDPVPPTSARFIVTGVGAAGSCVTFSGGGLSEQVDVVVLPTSFNGTVSATTPQGGDTVTINSTAQLKFDTALVTVTFAGGAAATIVSKTADQLRVLAPFSSPGPITIGGINVTYVTGLRATLPTTASVTQTGDNWAASGSWQTAPDISALLPAAASTSRMIVTRTTASNAAVCGEGPAGGSTGPCMMFRFDVAATTTYTFTIDWEGAALAPDVDIYHCNDSTVANLGTACFITGASGATAAKPQTTNADAYAPGTYWFVVEIYDGTGPRNAYVSIARP
jgi:hypothetical protein